jgi:hypothetical protein
VPGRATKEARDASARAICFVMKFSSARDLIGIKSFRTLQNVNDHEREGARTSGVTNLIVAVQATAPLRLLYRLAHNVEAQEKVPREAQRGAGAGSVSRS